MTKLEKALPAALPANDRDVESHPLWILRLGWDHVQPLARGGTHERENLVAACGGCNYNKGSDTLESLGLHHPFEREPPARDGWDGLDGRLGAKRILS